MLLPCVRKACSINAESMLNCSGIRAQFRRFGCAISVAYALGASFSIVRKILYLIQAICGGGCVCFCQSTIVRGSERFLRLHSQRPVLEIGEKVLTEPARSRSSSIVAPASWAYPHSPNIRFIFSMFSSYITFASRRFLHCAKQLFV